MAREHPSKEERFSHLSFRRYLSACRADHTRQLARPWYLSDDARDNDRVEVWKRQARCYAAWLIERDTGETWPDWRIVVTFDGRVYVGSSAHIATRLPAHALLD
jgi:hypothetical protein